MDKIYQAIGLMSGTSMDGIDIALIETNGKDYTKQLGFAFYAYKKDFVERLNSVVRDNTKFSKQLEDEFTELNVSAVNSFLSKQSMQASNIDYIGFHGHTIFHDPDNGKTWQIGNAGLLAKKTNISVYADFRTNDVKNKGQGAPLVPVYHQCLFAKQDLPLAIINIGGIANVTYISQDELIAFDTGPGCAIMNDLCKTHFNLDFDENGQLASKGEVKKELILSLLESPFFSKAYPKSLDRQNFNQGLFKGLEGEAAISTANYFTASCINKAIEQLPTKPKKIVLCGGGRLNKTLVDNIANITNIPTCDIDEYGFDGDSIEAEAFAYLAIRSKLDLPISFSGTTGLTSATGALSGGVFFPA